jgi:hypothetical protein
MTPGYPMRDGTVARQLEHGKINRFLAVLSPRDFGRWRHICGRAKDRGDEQHTNDYSGPIRAFRQVLAAGAIFN